jgi:nitrous oxidase accessory protein NosD
MIVRITRRALTATVLAMALLTYSLPAGAATPPPACRVKNVAQGTWFATNSGAALSDAIAAAHAGNRLNVFGRCIGSFAIDKDLTLAGWRYGSTTLSGGHEGRVLSIGSGPGVNVTLKDLVVTAGSSTIGGGGGIAVAEGAEVSLLRVKVLRNETTGAGGGIVNGGDLRLTASRVSRNHAGVDGGGIYNFGEVAVIRSTLYGNFTDGVGGGLFNEGSAVVHRSRIRHNTADFGGGILNVSLLTITQSDISDNTHDDCAC